MEQEPRPSTRGRTTRVLATSAVSALAAAPFLRVQTLMMAQYEHLLAGRMLGEPQTKIMDWVRTVYKQGGYFGFFRGAGPAVASSFANVGLMLLLKPVVDRMVPVARDEIEGMPLVFLKGMIIGTAIFPLKHAFKVLQIRMAADLQLNGKYQFSNPIETGRQIYKHHGIKGFLRGVFPSLWHSALTYGTQFTLFAALVVSLGENFYGFSTFLVPLLSASIVYPLEVIQTRMIMRNCEKDLYKGMWSCAKQISKHGFKGFWAGYTVTLIRMVAIYIPLALGIDMEAWVGRPEVTGRVSLYQEEENFGDNYHSYGGVSHEGGAVQTQFVLSDEEASKRMLDDNQISELKQRYLYDDD